MDNDIKIGDVVKILPVLTTSAAAVARTPNYLFIEDFAGRVGTIVAIKKSEPAYMVKVDDRQVALWHFQIEKISDAPPSPQKEQPDAT